MSQRFRVIFGFFLFAVLIVVLIGSGVLVISSIGQSTPTGIGQSTPPAPTLPPSTAPACDPRALYSLALVSLDQPNRVVLEVIALGSNITSGEVWANFSRDGVFSVGQHETLNPNPDGVGNAVDVPGTGTIQIAGYALLTTAQQTEPCKLDLPGSLASQLPPLSATPPVAAPTLQPTPTAAPTCSSGDFYALALLAQDGHSVYVKVYDLAGPDLLPSQIWANFFRGGAVTTVQNGILNQGSISDTTTVDVPGTGTIQIAGYALLTTTTQQSGPCVLTLPGSVANQ